MGAVESKDLLARLSAVEKLVRADLLSQYRGDRALMERAMQRLREEESSPGDAKAWLETFAGRGAVLYLLKTLYVRVLEDQGLLSPARIRDGGTYELFRRLFPQLGHGAYLRTVFRDAERALPELFAPTAVEIAWPGEASATAAWVVWQEAASGGGLRFDFRGELDTRFIGDLYQDLDPEVKARYALLQTPRFIESFILDRTMEPALAEVGLREFHIVDPTCGSGHFLLGAFERLARYWRAELGETPEARWESAVRALGAVHGADLNEYACALSRFRLMLAVLRETGLTDLYRLRTLHLDVIACDALIPWERTAQMLSGTARADASFAGYGTDDERIRNTAFFARGYHAVVGNPPYIAVKDKKKREDYRRAWPRSASGKYSLSGPMTERFLLMPLPGGRAGFIVANNFCKRSFGRGVVEKVLRDVRLDLVVDSSGTYIPGHGTPTAMLFASHVLVDLARHTALVVAGKRGEPREPSNAESGIVWSTIASNWADEGYEDTWIAVQRVFQTELTRHPWSLGNDAVTAIKAKLDAFPRLLDLGADVGPAVIIIEDEAFVRRYARALPLRPIVFGHDVRDWKVAETPARVAYPYEDDASLIDSRRAAEDLWSLRTTLWARRTFVGTFRSNARSWQEFERNRADRMGGERHRIVFGDIGTNGYFAVDNSDAIFTRHSPVVTIPDADAQRYRDIATALNSSTLEFWFKQVCFKKMDGGKAVKHEEWQKDYERNGSNVLQSPLPPHVLGPSSADGFSYRALTAAVASAIQELTNSVPSSIFLKKDASEIVSEIDLAENKTAVYRERLVALQEEIDWALYRAFELIDDVPMTEYFPLLQLARGHRPFEILLARRIAAGDEQSAWFDRHGLISTTEFPAQYVGAQREVLERRLTLIETDPTLALLEQPMYKRRWAFEAWGAVLREHAAAWLLDALGDVLRGEPRSLTADELVQRLRVNPKAVVIARYAKDAKDVELADTVARLLAAESVPDNPARVLTPAGLSKLVGAQTADTGRPAVSPAAETFADGEDVDWKRVWRLQEREDAGDVVTVGVPPPFKNRDYARSSYWNIRGKFNIPNERFVVYDELTPKRYAWGGWTTVERARLSMEAFELRGRESDGASIQPTLEDPRRCGIQFPLWDKLDELRRTDDPGYNDVRAIAQLCGRACPCDVVERWRMQPKPARDEASKNGKMSTARSTGKSVARLSGITSEQLAAILNAVRASGDVGLSVSDIEPMFTGDRDRARRAFEQLRSDGDVEPTGRGRGVRYRIVPTRLF